MGMLATHTINIATTEMIIINKRINDNTDNNMNNDNGNELNKMESNTKKYNFDFGIWI